MPGAGAGPWSPQLITDGFRKLRRAAKIEDASFHSLRHTAATRLLELGVSPKVVSERLGHSTIAITMDRYSHSTPSLQADAAMRLDAEPSSLLADVR
jgi:integrase